MNALFLQLEQTLSPALQSLDAQQTQLRPIAHPEKWTIQQITEHLLLTFSSTCNAVESRLAKGRPTAAHSNFKQRLAQVTLITCGFFPEGRPSPAMVSPPPTIETLSGPQLLQQLHQSLLAMDTVFDQARAAFGNRPAICHQILGPLTVQQWRRFHLVHARHHAKQIRAIRRAHSLPEVP
jgi:hypothetical protein